MSKSNNKNIIMTLVALLLVASLAVGFTYSWIEGGNKAYINSNEITINTGSNLTIRDHDGMITSILTFPVSDLYEVSSADGRSFFIPTDFDQNSNKNADDYVFFRNDSEWKNIYAQYWDKNNNEITTGLGVPLNQLRDGVYCVKVPENATTIKIYNKGTASNTGNLSIRRGEMITKESGTWGDVWLKYDSPYFVKNDDLFFREGTPTDENTKYVSLDFQIEAGDSSTDVYLGSGTVVQCSDPDINKALRMAFYKNDGSAPTVFRPSQMAGTTDGIKYNPIVAIDNDGKVNGTTEVTTEAYGKYYYQGSGDKSKPIFELKAGECLNVTMVLWLEGTEFEKEITEQDINVNIEFTTNADDLIKYTFIDNCHNTNGYNDKGDYVNHWVHNISESKYETMMYVYDYTEQRYYLLSKQNDTTWSGYVSSSVSDFVFRRYSIYDDTYWNEWEPSVDNIPTTSFKDGDKTVLERTFVAISGHPTQTSGANIKGCYGYWKDAEDTIRIYFEMGCKWDALHCYAETSDSNNKYPLKAWPGSSMNEVIGDNGNPYKVKIYDDDGKYIDDYPVYYIDIENASKLTYLEFNNGKIGNIYLESDYGPNNNGVYIYQQNNQSQQFLYTTEPNWSDWRGQCYVTLTEPYEEWFKIQQWKVDSSSNHVTSTKSGQVGKSYLFKSNGDLVEFVLKVTDSECYFNGSYFKQYYDGRTDYKVYTEKYDSLIYPVNKAATENQ